MKKFGEEQDPMCLLCDSAAARRALLPPHLSLQLSLPHSHVPSRKGLVSRFEVAGLHPCSFPFAVKSALDLFAWLLWGEATKTISRNSYKPFKDVASRCNDLFLQVRLLLLQQRLLSGLSRRVVCTSGRENFI